MEMDHASTQRDRHPCLSWPFWRRYNLDFLASLPKVAVAYDLGPSSLSSGQNSMLCVVYRGKGLQGKLEALICVQIFCAFGDGEVVVHVCGRVQPLSSPF